MAGQRGTREGAPGGGSPIGKQGEEGECKAGEGGRGLGQEAAEVDFLWR